MLIGWAIRGFGSWKLGRGGPIVVLLLLYWGWVTLGASLAVDKELAWGFVDYLSKIVLPFLVGVSVINSVEKLEGLAWTIVLSLGYVAFDFNQSYLSGFNRLYWVGFFGGDNNCAAIGLVSGIWLAFFAGIDCQSRWGKLAGLSSAFLITHAIFFSFSRGGMLGLFVSAIVAFWIMQKTPKHWIMAGFALVIGSYMAGPEVREEFQTVFADKDDRDESANSRTKNWKQCLELIAEEPIFGVGPDHYPIVNKERWGEGFEAHTLWLQLGAELGLPGVLLLMAFYGVCWVRLFSYCRGRAPPPDPRMRYIAQGIMASLIGFGVSSQFVSLEQLEIPYYLVMMGVIVLKLDSRPHASPFQGTSLDTPDGDLSCVAQRQR